MVEERAAHLSACLLDQPEKNLGGDRLKYLRQLSRALRRGAIGGEHRHPYRFSRVIGGAGWIVGDLLQECRARGRAQTDGVDIYAGILGAHGSSGLKGLILGVGGHVCTREAFC